MKGKKRGGKDWEPGRSGNPGGRPKLTESDKLVHRLTKETWNDLSQKMMSCTKDQLEDLIAKECPYEVELFIRHMLGLGERPDWHAYQKYLERRIGKVRDEVDVTLHPRPVVIHRRNGDTVVLGTGLDLESS